jgi:hypothetical protein
MKVAKPKPESKLCRNPKKATPPNTMLTPRIITQIVERAGITKYRSKKLATSITGTTTVSINMPTAPTMKLPREDIPAPITAMALKLLIF